MKHLAQELPCSNENERKFVEMALSMAQSFTGPDCRKLADPLRHAAGIAGVEVVIGTGGSHVWIHRLSQHKEGRPTESPRWMVITDEHLWANYWEKENAEHV